MKWDIKKMAKKVMRHGHHLPDRRLIHPDREWLIGLSIFAILLVVGTVYEIRNFLHYSSLESSVDTGEIQLVEYNQTNAARVLEIYQKKAETFKNILENYGGYVEAPSVDPNPASDLPAEDGSRTDSIEAS